MDRLNNIRGNELTPEQYGFFAPKTMNDLGSPINNELHMVLGLNTELQEINEILEKAYNSILQYKDIHSIKLEFDVDIVNLIEELGDILWYMSNLMLKYKGDVSELFQLSDGEPYKRNEFPDAVRRMGIEIGNFSDIVKREFAYGKDVNVDKKIRQLQTIYYEINNILYIINKELVNKPNYTIGHVMYINIHKLSKRFDSGTFDKFRVLNRDLDLEYETLKNDVENTPKATTKNKSINIMGGYIVYTLTVNPDKQKRTYINDYCFNSLRDILDTNVTHEDMNNLSNDIKIMLDYEPSNNSFQDGFIGLVLYKDLQRVLDDILKIRSKLTGANMNILISLNSLAKLLTHCIENKVGIYITLR